MIVTFDNLIDSTTGNKIALEVTEEQAAAGEKIREIAAATGKRFKAVFESNKGAV